MAKKAQIPPNLFFLKRKNMHSSGLWYGPNHVLKIKHCFKISLVDLTHFPTWITSIINRHDNRHSNIPQYLLNNFQVKRFHWLRLSNVSVIFNACKGRRRSSKLGVRPFAKLHIALLTFLCYENEYTILWLSKHTKVNSVILTFTNDLVLSLHHT